MSMRCVMAVVVAALAAGCAARPGRVPPPARPVEGWARPVPTAADIAARYNARLEGLDRLRAPITAVVNAPDGKGGRRRDQLEGSLMVVMPDRVALRLDKVGQTVFMLGADHQRYWSLDLSEKPAIAVVGKNEKASASSARRWGVPVHPLDLVDLLAIAPLPKDGQGLWASWSSDRRALAIMLPARSPGGSRRRLVIDASTYDPLRVELLDEAGGVLVSSALSRFVPVSLPGVAVSRTRVAERYEVRWPGEDTRVDFSIYDPSNPGERMRMQPFDLDALLEAFAITTVLDADVEPPR
jgi:hypothetical protein